MAHYSKEQTEAVYQFLMEHPNAHESDEGVLEEVAENLGRTENSIRNMLKRRLAQRLRGVDPEVARRIRAFFGPRPTAQTGSALWEPGDDRRRVDRSRSRSRSRDSSEEEEEPEGSAAGSSDRLAGRPRRSRRRRHHSGSRRRSPRVVHIFNGPVTSVTNNYYYCTRCD